MGSIAERLLARLAAAAKSDDLALDRYLAAVLILDPEWPADQERSVAVGNDQGFVVLVCQFLAFGSAGPPRLPG